MIFNRKVCQLFGIVLHGNALIRDVGGAVGLGANDGAGVFESNCDVDQAQVR